MPQNYLNAFRGPDLAEIDRNAYSNALLRNDVQRLPQRNAAEDFGIQADQQIHQQNMGDAQQKGASEFLMRSFSLMAQDPNRAQEVIASPAFQQASQALKLPAFSVDGETPQSIAQKSAAWAQAIERQPQTAAITQFERMAETGNLSPEERSRAARVGLGLEPRAVDMRERQPPSGYEWNDDGTLKATPGGPADPAGPNFRRNAAQLRKEYEDQKAVSDYRLVLPVYQRAATAEDTRAGDISIIYALGKIFDPGSVVREGELQLSMQAAPWLQQITSNINSQITGAGRLSPALRQELVRAMEGQVEALRAPYSQERGRYASYATDYGLTSDSVVGPDPADAFLPQGVKEEDVRFTMEKHGLSRAEVLKRLQGAP